MNQPDNFHEKEMRQVFVETLIELIQQGVDIAVLEADLARSTGTELIGRMFPERFFDFGVAEANMISIAAGMAIMGKIPFATSFGAFSSRRVIDQVYMAVTYSNLNIKIIGVEPGVTATVNGATHQIFEDLGLMRVLANMTVMAPCDVYELRQAVREAAHHKGAVYLRLLRKVQPVFSAPDYKFKIGKGNLLRDGRDITIISLGYAVRFAAEAAAVLEPQGICARVIIMPTIKPLDHELLLAAARDTGAIVTVENHNIIGGLGGAVCEFLSGRYPVPVRRVGMLDCIGEVGEEDYLCNRYGINTATVVREAHAALKLKRKRVLQ